MAEPDYNLVAKLVRNHYNLGESEAKLFTRLMERKRFTLDDVKKILKDIKETKANSRAYQLINTLKKNELIEEIKKSNPKTYKPLHPTVVYQKIKTEKETFDNAFGVIQQAYETFNEEESEPTSCFDVVSSESMMVNKLQELVLKKFSISKIIYKDQYIIDLVKRITSEDLSKKQEKGQANYIIFEKDKKDKVLFVACSNISLSGKQKREWVLIFDSSFASYLDGR